MGYADRNVRTYKASVHRKEQVLMKQGRQHIEADMHQTLNT